MSLISICIPTFNSEKYIAECLESVVNQTFENIEIIISDNNSTDNTLEIIKKLNINNLKIYKNNENLGMVENFNQAYKHSNGDFVKFLSSDDKLNKFAIEKSFEPFEKFNNLVLASTAKEIINSESKTIIRKVSNLKTGLYDGNYIIKKILLSGRNPVGEPTTALVKKEVIEYVDGFNSSYPMTLDIDFWLSILKYGDFYFIDEAYSSFRVHNNSYSVKKDALNEYRKWIKTKKDEKYINSAQYVQILLKFQISKLLKKLIYIFNVK